MPSGTAYELREVAIAFGGHTVLAIPHLEIAAGKITVVSGPNGAGKSVLLRVLALLLPPQTGSVSVFGKPVNYSESALRAVRRRITMVAQNPFLFHRSVRANVAFGLQMRGVCQPTRVDAALAALGLEGFAERAARKLSGGEAQRVAIARAIAFDPEILLLDEPTANLDRAHVPIIEELMHSAAARGRTVIFTTHDLDQAVRLGDEQIALSEGRPSRAPFLNLLRGVVIHKNETTYFLCEGAQIEIPTGAEPRLISIDPAEILLSRQPLDSSARNCLAGTIRQVEYDPPNMLLTVDCGPTLRARITANSYRNLGLNVGERVFLTFKSTAIQMHG